MLGFVVMATFCTIVILFGGVGVWITQEPGLGNLDLINQIACRIERFYSFSINEVV